MKMKNTLKLIFALLAIVLILIVIRSLPKKTQENNINTSNQSTDTELISPTATLTPILQEKLDTPEEILERLESDSDIDYTTQLNAIESEIN